MKNAPAITVSRAPGASYASVLLAATEPAAALNLHLDRILSAHAVDHDPAACELLCEAAELPDHNPIAGARITAEALAARVHMLVGDDAAVGALLSALLEHHLPNVEENYTFKAAPTH